MDAAEKVNNPGKKLHLHRRLLKTLNKLINFPTFFVCENKQPRKKEVMAEQWRGYSLVGISLLVFICTLSLSPCAWVIMNWNEFPHTQPLIRT